MTVPQQTPAAAPNWKIIIAFILDLFTAFFVLGYLIALLTDSPVNTEATVSFNLEGLPAVILFAGIIGYFIIGNRLGGTLWKRILKIPVR